MQYSPETLAHFRAPRGVGAFERLDARTGSGSGGDFDQGAYVVMHVRLDQSGEHVEEARFRGFGCPAVIASASLVVERIAGTTLAEAEALEVDDVVSALRLPQARRSSADAAITALRAALADVLAKRGGAAR